MTALKQRSGRAGADAVTALSIIQGGAALHPQYIRLFGLIPADQAISSAPSSPGQVETSGSPLRHCDPSHAASQLFQSVLADAGHPSAASLGAIADLRLRHAAKGHTPEADAAHGPLYWICGVREWWGRAMSTRSSDNRRKALIAAASLLVAMIDAEDFTAKQQEPTP